MEGNLNDYKFVKKRDIMNHLFYEDGDKDAPYYIKDRNGQIALNVCKICGLAEGSLTTDCPGIYVYKSDEVYDGKIDFINGEWKNKVSPYSPINYILKQNNYNKEL